MLLLRDILLFHLKTDVLYDTHSVKTKFYNLIPLVLVLLLVNTCTHDQHSIVSLYKFPIIKLHGRCTNRFNSRKDIDLRRDICHQIYLIIRLSLLLVESLRLSCTIVSSLAKLIKKKLTSHPYLFQPYLIFSFNFVRFCGSTE